VVGLPEDKAIRLLENWGFTVQVTTITDPGPPGMVLGQDPAPGSPARQGTMVTITVSFGSPPSPPSSPSPSPSPSGSPSPSPSPSSSP
jgi:beta-lactam-binding protein with PASTA domain